MNSTSFSCSIKHLMARYYKLLQRLVITTYNDYLVIITKQNGRYFTYSESREDISSCTHTDTNHTVDSVKAFKSSINWHILLKTHKWFETLIEGMFIRILWTYGIYCHLIVLDWGHVRFGLTLAESGLRAAFQQAHPWWGTGTWGKEDRGKNEKNVPALIVFKWMWKYCISS